MRRIAISLVVVAGCGGEVDCIEGYVEGDDGLCLQVADGDDVVEAIVAELPSCEAGAAGVSEFQDGCVHGLCLGVGTFAEAEAELGPADTCSDTSRCEWDGGAIVLTFNDVDFDGSLQPTDQVVGFELAEASGETNAAGYGIGVSAACAVEDLGTPTGLFFVPVTGGHELGSLAFGDLQLDVAQGLVTHIRWQ